MVEVTRIENRKRALKNYIKNFYTDVRGELFVNPEEVYGALDIIDSQI